MLRDMRTGAEGSIARIARWKAPERQNYENVTLSYFHAAHAGNSKRTETVFLAEANFSKT